MELRRQVALKYPKWLRARACAEHVTGEFIKRANASRPDRNQPAAGEDSAAPIRRAEPYAPALASVLKAFEAITKKDREAALSAVDRAIERRLPSVKRLPEMADALDEAERHRVRRKTGATILTMETSYTRTAFVFSPGRARS